MELMFEYCSHGTLRDAITAYRERREWVPVHVAWSYFAQLVAALHHCHHALGSTVVLHRDIKPPNGKPPINTGCLAHTCLLQCSSETAVC